VSVLRRLLRDAAPRRALESDLPEELWAGLAANVGAEDPEFGIPLAQALHDRLAWDREPAGLQEWDRLGQEKPLEALWMAALSETKAVRKAFPRFSGECLRAFRASPACVPPSWEFVEGLLELQSETLRGLREAEKRLEDAERRFEAERQRSDDLRDELKKLRRETSELRADRAQTERRAAAALEAQARIAARPADAQRLEELDRKLRKAEKEIEHLRRELARERPAAPVPSVSFEPEALAEGEAEPAAETVRGVPPMSEDPNPHRRVLRQMLRKLFKKGKIGASHTHEDNVYRGVADHEKGIAKEAMDLLYREGLLMPKPTATDPHVSLNPEHAAEIRAIYEKGEIDNPRLRRFVEEGG
jgi:hypothetical protein